MRYYAIACAVAVLIFAALWSPMMASAYPHSDDPTVTQWVWDFHGWVPLDAVNAEIKVGECPGVPNAGGCADVDAGIIWISRDSLDKDTVAHELGHFFDRQVLNDGMRNKIMYRFFQIGGQVWMPYVGEEALVKCPHQNICSNELFADGFSACARHITPYLYTPDHQWDQIGGYGLDWTPKIKKRLCPFIVKVGSRVSSWAS
jgi:hypothetical protein